MNFPAVNLSASNTVVQPSGSPKVFVPFSEDLVARYGLSLGDLVPFHTQYTCLRLRECAESAAAESAAAYGWSDVEIEQPA